jgi:hypothetical protein
MQHATLALVALSLTCATNVANAQRITRDTYFEYLPPFSKLVGQTRASMQFHLFGDTSNADYVDQHPADGIDDVRAQRLRRIAERFSPILRRNNFSAPRSFRDVVGDRPVLHIDRWSDGRRVRSDSILLFDPTVFRSNGEDVFALRKELERSDELLDSLVRALHPLRGDSRVVAPEQNVQSVLFIDFPGQDPVLAQSI